MHISGHFSHCSPCRWQELGDESWAGVSHGVSPQLDLRPLESGEACAGPAPLTGPAEMLAPERSQPLLSALLHDNSVPSQAHTGGQ